MNILGLRKFIAVAALVVAAFGTNGSRPAFATVVFNFSGVCGTPCANEFGGTGASVTGVLELADAAVFPPTGNGPFNYSGNFASTDIEEFTLFFTPIGPGPTSITFGTIASLSNAQFTASPLEGIESMNLSDVAGNFFSYIGLGGGEASAEWLILNSNQDLAQGVIPLSFNIAVPEPSSLLPFMLGSIGLLVLARRRGVSQART